MAKKYLIFLMTVLFVSYLFAQDNIIDTEEELIEILKKDGIHEVILVGYLEGSKDKLRGMLVIGSAGAPFLYVDSNEKIDNYHGKIIKIKSKLKVDNRSTRDFFIAATQLYPPYIESVEEIQEYKKGQVFSFL
ncbi:MAG: hypothetical protein QMD94_03765 [Candidatus Omnitrophota bacterium]|nr:hypothetical protein [Candidatus Omnitrophota bacterium]